MRVHHLNCATLCPVGGAAVAVEKLVCHCLLVEAPGGLVLVDTGLGTEDLRSPIRRLGPGFLALTRPARDPAEPAVAQLRRLGFSARDVRDVIVTHLDPDHAGGLSDFPDARVHVHAVELEGALAPRALYERVRYRPIMWRHRPSWVRHRAGGDRWMGFDSIRALDGDQVLLIPLVGHTRGHVGVAVNGEHGWLLHAGDAFFHHGELDEPPHAPPGILAMQRLDDFDHDARVANQARLRALARGGEVRIVCAHDLHQFESVVR
ncbi:MAG TPA: MBL fold metallo-hydrolase [Polyangia bacterium]|nr:MBL fold metallo-hydrolase [Polyangia bacterium]